MDNSTLLSYLQWADSKVMTLLKANLDHLTENAHSLVYAKLLHLVEEYRAWLFDLQKKSWKEKVESYSSMETDQLLGEISDLHEEWVSYINETEITVYDITESAGTVIINLDEVIFNLINHSSYHRGQIMMILRQEGIEVPVTDYYWFKRANLPTK